MSRGFAIAIAGSVLLGGVLLGAVETPPSGAGGSPPAEVKERITIDYPLEGSVFPPEITPPTFLFRDGSDETTRWIVDVSFAGRSERIRVQTTGDHMAVGEVDPKAGPLLPLTADQAATRTWRPDAETWSRIKGLSSRSLATVAISGYGVDEAQGPISLGRVTLSTSADPVGAPIFYRDVPLMLSPPGAKGAIQPLPPSAIPLIKWRIRNIGEPTSRVVMENLPTCANCHSFSRDGKTLGLDLDGPTNDKGLYALVPVSQQMTIGNHDVIRWSSFLEDPTARTSKPAVKRFGFMSQVSPDGRYVVTSIGPPGGKNLNQKENPDFAPGLSDRLFSTTYNDLRFNQVFYPTRGILVWYDRDEHTLRPLPGADDPRFVQTSAFWSPDGKYLIYSRAEARDPYPQGAPKPVYANDPNEPLIQYDLYRIPFNGGKGGKPEPLEGASRNGMSNNFPKVSPDGRWIVFVENHNGLLMRPDSKLYIVPSSGGKARLMTCNLSLMNSWHSFSPNGRWLAFSSKARGAYTRLMLTHIDTDGRDTPPVMVEDMTATNRAVNIPEFVNVASDGLEKIDPQATELYRLFNEAYELMAQNKASEAAEKLKKAEEQDPDDALVHYALARALADSGQDQEAVEEFRKAVTLNASNASWFGYFAMSLARTGDLQAAVANGEKALALDPSAGAETQLGVLLFESGKADEAYTHLKRGVELAPDQPVGRFRLGLALAKMGRTDEAIEQLRQVVILAPSSPEYRFNLGYVLAVRGDLAGAAEAYEKAVDLGEGRNWQPLAALADIYSKTGRLKEAILAVHRALDLALQEHNEPLERSLRVALGRYESESAKAEAR